MFKQCFKSSIEKKKAQSFESDGSLPTYYPTTTSIPLGQDTKGTPITPGIPLSVIQEFNDSYTKDANNILPQTALLENPVSILQKHLPPNYNFCNSLVKLPVTNQESSGRCWLFAASNLIRRSIIPKLDLDPSFQISQKYFYFWDTFEKCNWALESPASMNREILAGISDGGQWDMFVNVIEKYGACPFSVYPDSYHSLHTSELKRIINQRVRGYKCLLADPINKQHKMSYLKDIYTILCTLLGSPPTEFQWEYTTATKSQYIPSMVSLVNDPRHEYKKVMTVEGLGNVVGGGQVTYLNLESNALLAFVANRLAEKIPVWFGCDVGQELDKSRGIMRAHLTVEPEAFGSRVKLNKKERLDFGESMMTHAMLFVGCHIENGKVLRLLVENSWGNVGGEKGYFVMTAEWFHEYLYQIVIDKSILNAELKKELDVGERIILPLFDPM